MKTYSSSSLAKLTKPNGLANKRKLCRTRAKNSASCFLSCCWLCFSFIYRYIYMYILFFLIFYVCMCFSASEAHTTHFQIRRKQLGEHFSIWKQAAWKLCTSWATNWDPLWRCQIRLQKQRVLWKLLLLPLSWATATKCCTRAHLWIHTYINIYLSVYIYMYIYFTRSKFWLRNVLYFLWYFFERKI